MLLQIFWCCVLHLFWPWLHADIVFLLYFCMYTIVITHDVRECKQDLRVAFNQGLYKWSNHVFNVVQKLICLCFVFVLTMFAYIFVFRCCIHIITYTHNIMQFKRDLRVSFKKRLMQVNCFVLRCSSKRFILARLYLFWLCYCYWYCFTSSTITIGRAAVATIVLNLLLLS